MKSIEAAMSLASRCGVLGGVSITHTSHDESTVSLAIPASRVVAVLVGLFKWWGGDGRDWFFWFFWFLWFLDAVHRAVLCSSPALSRSISSDQGPDGSAKQRDACG